jgi:dethiobiotin synthetase
MSQPMITPRGVLVITGTGTGVGKTIVTAAIAA